MGEGVFMGAAKIFSDAKKPPCLRLQTERLLLVKEPNSHQARIESSTEILEYIAQNKAEKGVFQFQIDIF
jgi:hypothetical protein